jgi:hypothetical protein
LEHSRLALAQIVTWSVGTVVLTIAVAAIHLGYDAAEPFAALASFIVLGAMLLFGYLVFRPASSPAAQPVMHLTPAE